MSEKQPMSSQDQALVKTALIAALVAIVLFGVMLGGCAISYRTERDARIACFKHAESTNEIRACRGDNNS